MSRIEELIKEKCSEGVEFRKLEDCCSILDKKRKPVTKSAREAGEYPYYGANGIQDYVSDFIFDGIFVLVGEDGSVVTPNGSPIVTWAEGKIWVNNHAHIIEEIEGVDLRYMYHYLQTVYVGDLIHGNIPKLNQGDFRQIEIAVPPIEIQQEIVRILDKFTELEAGLQAELDARKKQYEHYRDKLMAFNETEVEWKRLDEIFTFIRNGFVGKVTSFFTDAENGIRYLEGTNIHNGVISDNEVLYVTKEFHQKHKKNELKSDDILMVQSGHIGECAMVGEKYKGSNCHALIIMSNGGAGLSKFYVHYFHSFKGFRSLTPAITGGTIKHVLAGKVGNIKVPVPTLEKQKEIVDILNKLERYCFDEQDGLPAEIEARHKQYEYYRDKLLTFERKVV